MRGHHGGLLLCSARPAESANTDILDAVVPDATYTVDHHFVSTSLLVAHHHPGLTDTLEEAQAMRAR